MPEALPRATPSLMHSPSPTPQLGLHHVFRWEAAQHAHILLYPEGMVKLNPAAAEILQRCDGLRTVAQIIDDLDAAFPGNRTAIERDAHAFIATACDKGWLRL